MSDPGTDTSTNWVRSCNSDAECGDDNSCLCETCTKACENDGQCGVLAGAVCRPAPSDCSGPSQICVAENYDAGAGVLPLSLPPRAEPAWAIFDAARAGRSLVVGLDGYIYVTGGEGRAQADLSVQFENFWIAQFTQDGTPGWEQIIPLNDSTSTGLSITLGGDGLLTTVSTIYDGSDTPQFRQFDLNGQLQSEFSLEPGITRLTTDPAGGLVGAGSRLIEQRDGRPFTELWVGGIEEQAITWQHTARGVEGSISNAWDVVVDESGYLVGGSRGRAASSNASDAWLLSGDPNGADIDWSEVPQEGGGNARGLSVARATEGGVLIAGYGDSAFIAHHSRGGKQLWLRELEERPSSVLNIASQSAYAIGYLWGDGVNRATGQGRVDLFDWDGSLIWTFDDPGCESVMDMVETDDGIVALLECGYSLGLVHIPFKQKDGATLSKVPELRACAESAECESGYSCQNGTCAQECTLSEDCPSGLDYRCVHDNFDNGQCPVLAVGELGTPGVCLPRCFDNMTCAQIAPGLHCAHNSCVQALPECEERCLRLIGDCAEGCTEIRGRAFNPTLSCIEIETRLIGCYPDGRTSTEDDGCVKSADGLIYSAGGFLGATLMRNFSFSQCAPEDSDAFSNASTCE